MCLYTKMEDKLKTIINRDRYIQQIVPLIGNGRVKIITGIRRCGKSFLLKTLFTQYLKKHGIN